MALSGNTSGAVVVGVTSALTIVAGLAVVSRLITRIAIVRNAGYDDVCISLSMALSIALTAAMNQQIKYGMGRHHDDLTNDDKFHLLRWCWASMWIYCSSLCFSKVSIVLQYLRAFPQSSFRKACFALLGVIVAYSFATFLTSVLACVPVDSFWNSTVEGTCVNLEAFWFANAGINIILDVGIGVLPLPVLHSLDLSRRGKYALTAVFALGGLTCIISILRLQSIYIVAISPDTTRDSSLAAIWSSTECNLVILCSCLPTMKGCITRFWPRLFERGRGGIRRNSDDALEWQSDGVNLKTLELLGSYEFEIRSHVHPCERRQSWRELESFQVPRRQWSAPASHMLSLGGSDQFDDERYDTTHDSTARSKLKETKVYQPTGKPQKNLEMKSRPHDGVRATRYSWPLTRGSVEPQIEDMRRPYSKLRS